MVRSHVRITYTRHSSAVIASPKKICFQNQKTKLRHALAALTSSYVPLRALRARDAVLVFGSDMLLILRLHHIAPRREAANCVSTQCWTSLEAAKCLSTQCWTRRGAKCLALERAKPAESPHLRKQSAGCCKELPRLSQKLGRQKKNVLSNRLYLLIVSSSVLLFRRPGRPC